MNSHWKILYALKPDFVVNWFSQYFSYLLFWSVWCQLTGMIVFIIFYDNFKGWIMFVLTNSFLSEISNKTTFIWMKVNICNNILIWNDNINTVCKHVLFIGIHLLLSRYFSRFSSNKLNVMPLKLFFCDDHAKASGK